MPTPTTPAVFILSTPSRVRAISRKRLSVVLLGLLSISLSAEDALFRANAHLVILHATVTNGRGDFLDALPPDAFEIREDGAPQKVSFVRREDVPVSLGLLIDNSASMRGKRAEVEAAAFSLVELSNPADEVFVVNFSGEGWLDQDFTRDKRLLKRGLTRITSEGFTAIRDSVDGALWHMESGAAHDKKALIVVSDGDDNLSSTPMKTLLERLKQADTAVYAIGLLGDEDMRGKRRARKALEAMANATGGHVYYARQLGDVMPLARRIAIEIRQQYVIGYVPANTTLDGQFRKVQVSVATPTLRGNVRTRPGYYAVTAQDTRRPRRIAPANVPLLPGFHAHF